MAEKTTYDAQAARLAIEADRQERVERCAKRVQEVLDEERCQVVARPQFTKDGRVVAVPQIVATE